MRRRAKSADLFPAPLREFREAEWPRVDGECLGHYACRGEGYSAGCVPRPGEFCGQLCYESLARDYPGRPELLGRHQRADAYTRFHQARLNWIGEDNPVAWFDEFVASRDHEIRYGRPRG